MKRIWCSMVALLLCLMVGSAVATEPELEKRSKPRKPPAESTSAIQQPQPRCLETCAQTRVTCEQEAQGHPDQEVRKIGSTKNNEWSRTCHNSYAQCLQRCS